MAKGKKSSGKTYISKGQRPNMNRDWLKAYRRDMYTPVEVALNKLEAWKRGKNPWLTVPNPNTKETNKRFVRVRANDIYGDWRNSHYMMKPRTELVDVV